jgi:rfaE bifunctional protein nucleotidyltransferase chain/domain
MKIKTLEEILPLVSDLKKLNKKIVFTNGCFDIIHAGHVQYLEDARALGDVLIVGMNSDSSVKIIKDSSRPIISEEERAIVVSGLSSVSYIIFFEEDTPYNLIKKIKPNVLVKGGDWKPKDIVGSDIVSATGGEVKSLMFRNGISTTEIINRIKKL